MPLLSDGLGLDDCSSTQWFLSPLGRHGTDCIGNHCLDSVANHTINQNGLDPYDFLRLRSQTRASAFLDSSSGARALDSSSRARASAFLDSFPGDLAPSSQGEEFLFDRSGHPRNVVGRNFAELNSRWRGKIDRGPRDEQDTGRGIIVLSILWAFTFTLSSFTVKEMHQAIIAKGEKPRCGPKTWACGVCCTPLAYFWKVDGPPKKKEKKEDSDDSDSSSSDEDQSRRSPPRAQPRS
eukprot:gnl/MRDRNA2_/MRDRNA2_27197_c0_seq2.p1 gnl/MRDRNA2_/MRDRNA2_27197_c0~~gnl/MRDRNA2_/MRDRNA2_27197_c0_seq2.p1  ORF type:complete len:237 (-),score=32.81 gnl/MRDRNA2_/MRDRNA2_27197_c0_seq2:22-732(-)